MAVTKFAFALLPFVALLTSIELAVDNVRQFPNTLFTFHVLCVFLDLCTMALTVITRLAFDAFSVIDFGFRISLCFSRVLSYQCITNVASIENKL